ncbi:hypothetical protein N234_18845 [Ralstonia pickettii DTP0602]|nr:hypothetical protein N234_18845 [Ralstonia pickettii DTP0602]
MTPNTLRREIEQIESSFRAQGYITRRLTEVATTSRSTDDSVRETEKHRRATSKEISSKMISEHLSHV